tara:strand:- start:987 stop:1694 length:708 start_codon:yes stop_codon:yes gene_type:complete
MNLRTLQSYSINKDFYKRFYKDLNHGGKKNKDAPVAHIKNKPVNNTSNSVVYNSLFWTFYSLIKNEQEVVLDQNKFKLKNAFSMKFVEDIKKDKTFLKQNKLRFHDIESSILYDKDIALPTLKCLVLFFKLNLIYAWNNKYYIFESNNDDKFYFIERNREKYTCEKDLEKNIIQKDKVKNKLFMEDVREQLKSPTSYKADDLKVMAKTLNIPLIMPDGKRKTKQQLYEEIITKID